MPPRRGTAEDCVAIAQTSQCLRSGLPAANFHFTHEQIFKIPYGIPILYRMSIRWAITSTFCKLRRDQASGSFRLPWTSYRVGPNAPITGCYMRGVQFISQLYRQGALSAQSLKSKSGLTTRPASPSFIGWRFVNHILAAVSDNVSTPPAGKPSWPAALHAHAF